MGGYVLICLLASSVCVCVNADAGGPGIIFDSSLSHEGVLIILAIEQLDPRWKQLLTLTLLTSEGWLVLFTKWLNFVCQKTCLYDFRVTATTLANWLLKVLFPVLTFEYGVSIQYLRPEHWRSCSGLQPENKERKEQSASEADRRRREGDRSQRRRQLEPS